MGRFTFATGNLKKIAALPLYGLGAAAAAIVPRRRGLWVFGSGTGVGEGSLALLQHVRATDASARVIWLARDTAEAADARAQGLPVALKSSWRGFRLTLRAQVIVVSHGFGDVNRFATSGGFVVNVWHGIPFKRIRIDSPEAMRVPVFSSFAPFRALITRAYARAGRGIAVFATASEASAARIRTAFALTSRQALVTGDPRDDVLCAGGSSAAAAAERESRARKLVAGLLSDERFVKLPVIMYAPTWRDGQGHPAIPTMAEWRALAEFLDRTDQLMIVRAHPLGRGDFAAGTAVSSRIRMLGSELQHDVNPLLPAVAALITDYSSIAFDYALVGGPLLFLAPDVANYASSRGVYEPYANFSGGSEVSSWRSMLELLPDATAPGPRRDALVGHSRALRARFHAFADGGNTARLYDVVRRRLDGDPDAMPPLPDPGSEAAGSGAVPALEVDSLTVTTDASGLFSLVLAGPHPGEQAAPQLRLSGARAVLEGESIAATGRWQARIPLAAYSWGGLARPPRSGRYTVSARSAAGRMLLLEVTASLPTGRRYGDAFRLRASTEHGTLTIELSAPLEDDELGSANQKRLEAAYRTAPEPLTQAVFFESYFGQNVSCNPLGIDRALAAQHPEVTRYWSVVDASVPVPDGAIAVVEGSAQWWHARGTARLLVINDWLRKRYRERAGQTVLQTWHGTPLKRLALDKSGFRPRARLAVLRERSRWNVLLAQNEFSAHVFRSAYAFRGPIWEEGYPRDDAAVTGDASAVRARLGIPEGKKVVLYAPTWRDDRPGVVDHLDVKAFAERLGDDHVTLIRGHSRTLAPGASVTAAGVIDVTGYPDISELYLAADLLVTDYSSVMFDFTVTGKPLFFYVPDLDHYRDSTRGFNFDLSPVAPGPVVTELDALVEAVQDAAGSAARYADRYRAWRARFNPRDDGHAGQRVVERIFREGLL